MPQSLTDPASTSSIESEQQPLPRWLRALLLLAGLVFLGVGIVMLAIPILPQVWAFAIAAVCFSLASRSVWLWLERKLRRFPRVHATATSLRERLLERLSSEPPSS